MSYVDKQTTIMTPIFEGTRYKHHVCSECKGTLTFEQSIWGGLNFYTISHEASEGVKYCPLCGSEIVRFSDKPIYETPIDLKPLDIFADLYLEYERKAKWLYHCYISEERQNKIESIVTLIKKGDISGYYLKGLECAKMGKGTFGVSYQRKRKLRKEFGEETE